MKTAELMRRTPLSTGRKVTPTVDESARMFMVKTLGCVCCMINNVGPHKVASTGPCDAHHLLSGGVRRGHRFTIGLCKWHHVAEPPVQGMGRDEAIRLYGPSVATGSKPFHDIYGSDDELLEFQNALLEAMA